MNNPEIPNDFVISKKMRFIENLHIVFWLVKDMGWCLNFKSLGISMAIPTICIALYFLIKNRKDTSERYHNFAVLLWIVANSWWMCSEFFGFDETVLLFGLTGRSLTAFPFGIGILILSIYYIFLFPKESKTMKNQS